MKLIFGIIILLFAYMFLGFFATLAVAAGTFLLLRGMESHNVFLMPATPSGGTKS